MTPAYTLHFLQLAVNQHTNEAQFHQVMFRYQKLCRARPGGACARRFCGRRWARFAGGFVMVELRRWMAALDPTVARDSRVAGEEEGSRQGEFSSGLNIRVYFLQESQ